MMNEDAVSCKSASSLFHVLFQLKYSEAKSVLMVKEGLTMSQQRLKMYLIILQRRSSNFTVK